MTPAASDELREIAIPQPAPAAPPPTVGRYRVCGEIASGGMASVYLGVSEGETSPGAVRAIKRVHPHLARQRAFVEMFVDEARISARIKHPNVCEVLEWGEADGTFHLAMELLAGEPVVTLLRRLKKKPQLLIDPRWHRCVARIVAGACAGLHAAHELTDDEGEPMLIVHRDISPHNLFVTWEGTAKVVDFGVASAKHRLHHTTTGTVKGKFAYMSPEQLQGAKVDRRADVWALGVVLWELLTGRPLFRRNTESETIFAVLKEKVPTFASVRPQAPEALEQIARAALKHDLARRTPTAKVMQDALEAWLAAQGGFEASDVAALLDELMPGERDAYHAWLQKALTGGNTLTPQREAELTAPAPAATGSARVELDDQSMIQRRAQRGRARWILLGVGVGLLMSIGGGAAAWELARGSSRDTTSVGTTERPPVTHAPAPAVELPLAAAPPIDVTPVPSTPALAPTPPAAEAAPMVTAERPAAPATAVTAVRQAAPRAARIAARAVADGDDDGSGVGSLDVATPGGWAEVWLDGRRLGHTPGRFELPVGRHTLVLRPGGGGEERRAAVRIVGGQLARLRVELAE
ncbi:serine/threonine-protein kinase [Sandaracinus amylolyticus]|nr:serine/threonine-protein kinase [Sandaracinus amylolyticus]